jgi:hypothetical protein
MVAALDEKGPMTGASRENLYIALNFRIEWGDEYVGGTRPDDYGPKAAAADDRVIALTEIEP